jgi:hypothetical protein
MANPEVRRVTNILVTSIEKTIARLSVNITAELIERTPVDTGWARANWVPALGSPSSELATTSPDSSDVPGQSNRQSSGISSVLGYKLRNGEVFISNNVPYIERLNEGTSNQAPKGFVQDGIEAGIKSLDGINIE